MAAVPVDRGRGRIRGEAFALAVTVMVAGSIAGAGQPSQFVSMTSGSRGEFGKV